MYKLGIIDSKMVMNSERAKTLYTSPTEDGIFKMLTKLAKLGAVYLKDREVRSRVECNTLLEIIEEQAEMSFKGKLEDLLKPLLEHPATLN